MRVAVDLFDGVEPSGAWWRNLLEYDVGCCEAWNPCVGGACDGAVEGSEDPDAVALAKLTWKLGAAPALAMQYLVDSGVYKLDEGWGPLDAVFPVQWLCSAGTAVATVRGDTWTGLSNGEFWYEYTVDFDECAIFGPLTAEGRIDAVTLVGRVQWIVPPPEGRVEGTHSQMRMRVALAVSPEQPADHVWGGVAVWGDVTTWLRDMEDWTNVGGEGEVCVGPVDPESGCCVGTIVPWRQLVQLCGEGCGS